MGKILPLQERIIRDAFQMQQNMMLAIDKVLLPEDLVSTIKNFQRRLEPLSEEIRRQEHFKKANLTEMSYRTSPQEINTFVKNKINIVINLDE